MSWIRIPFSQSYQSMVVVPTSVTCCTLRPGPEASSGTTVAQPKSNCTGPPENGIIRKTNLPVPLE